MEKWTINMMVLFALLAVSILFGLPTLFWATLIVGPIVVVLLWTYEEEKKENERKDS